MTDAGRGLFDETPPARRDEAASTDPAHVAATEVHPR